MNQTRSEEGRGKINLIASNQSNDYRQGETLGNIVTEEIQNKKIKNLISAIIVLAGVTIGSLLIDVVQFLTQSGYSEKALEKTEIFSAGGKTWVAFEDPTVEVKVLTVSEEELAECPNCDPAEVLYQLKKVIPTLVAKKIVDSSSKGEKMIEDYQINAIPSFIFSKDVTKTSFYQQSGVSSVFDEKNDEFVLNSNVLGIQAGKYLKVPEISENDAILGDANAKVKMVIFSDYQCPYSKMFYDIAKAVLPDYQNEVAFVLKDLPLGFHPQAQNAAMSARCAQDQGKFWEMSDLLYKNQSAWGEVEGKNVFKSYALQLGLNANQFNQCLDADAHLDRITEEGKVAGEFGLTGTPSGFIGDEFMGGVLQDAKFRQTLDAQLAK